EDAEIGAEPEPPGVLALPGGEAAEERGFAPGDGTADGSDEDSQSGDAAEDEDEDAGGRRGDAFGGPDEEDAGAGQDEDDEGDADQFGEQVGARDAVPEQVVVDEQEDDCDDEERLAEGEGMAFDPFEEAGAGAWIETAAQEHAGNDRGQAVEDE